MHETKKNVALLISLLCLKHPVSAQQLLNLSARVFGLWAVHTGHSVNAVKVLIKTVLFTEVCWDFSDMMCVWYCGSVGFALRVCVGGYFLILDHT